MPARLLAASAAEMRDLPLAVPDAPELSVPNGGLGAELGRARIMDCVGVPRRAEADVDAGRASAAPAALAVECTDCERPECANAPEAGGACMCVRSCDADCDCACDSDADHGVCTVDAADIGDVCSPTNDAAPSDRASALASALALPLASAPICATASRHPSARRACETVCGAVALVAPSSNSSLNPRISFNICVANITLPLACSASACCRSWCAYRLWLCKL